MKAHSVQHTEDVLHLGCGRRDEREAVLPQGGSDKRNGHRVQDDKRPPQQTRDNDAHATPALFHLNVALQLSLRRGQERPVL
ncbi:hypothetical protein EYF80_012399 [Liparis tanakae]|uniref:Uncharacterized protein n=1 Tax=Liparis tanakae TaxID=230148 RepID=A0A4Z2IHX0_9TELE|nr:hypothetical protein EYF80_012399 [Liparis tanakae]